MLHFPLMTKFFLLTMIFFFPVIKYLEAETKTAEIWNGVWFTCEFSQRTRAPDDKCKMFDNEGFKVNNGIFTYLEMINSTEENCRGNKKGHCFNSNMNSIFVKEAPIGKIEIGPDHLFVKYLGCKQRFSFKKAENYYAVIPDKKNCFWASKRHFYVARYLGELSIKN